MSNSSTSGYSRFQAILSAKPGSEIPPTLPTRPYPQNALDTWPSGTSQDRKRKRAELYPKTGPNLGSALKTALDNEATAAKEQPVHYSDRQQLLDALRDRFRHAHSVDFNGTYEIIEPTVTHKHRIQNMSHEIWKATGYRFTVKDHPQIKDGHKTRFWCSQDEAHRSKQSRAARMAQSAPKPRLSSGGEALAKTRYPCRSRLLISSRDANLPGHRIITVRMHHQVPHEPYVDASLPPEVTQAIWESFGWMTHLNSNAPRILNHTEEGDLSASEDEGSEAREDMGRLLDDEKSPSGSTGTPHVLLDPEIYHQRMRAHISNIRDFCDGLEYQLQFNDYRMLGVLEKEGGSFLRLVEDCLKKEGRLVSPIQNDHPPATISYREQALSTQGRPNLRSGLGVIGDDG